MIWAAVSRTEGSEVETRDRHLRYAVLSSLPSVQPTSICYSTLSQQTGLLFVWFVGPNNEITEIIIWWQNKTYFYWQIFLFNILIININLYKWSSSLSNWICERSVKLFILEIEVFINEKKKTEKSIPLLGKTVCPSFQCPIKIFSF